MKILKRNDIEYLYVPESSDNLPLVVKIDSIKAMWQTGEGHTELTVSGTEYGTVIIRKPLTEVLAFLNISSIDDASPLPF